MMEMPEKLKELLNSMGMLGELCSILRDSLMRNGFTREEAVSIVSAVVAKTFEVPRGRDNG